MTQRPPPLRSEKYPRGESGRRPDGGQTAPPPRFPTPRLRLFLWLYKAAWILGLPLILLYLRRRARRDPAYGAHLPERFGRYADPLPGSVWVHAVSLGELRSAVPLIRALLDRGETVVTTHFTPAGRREAEKAFAAEIEAGRLRPVWIPFEYDRTLTRFLRDFTPKYGLVMEIEIWPQMILTCRRRGVPLFMCNAQYPSKSYARDTTRTRWRAELMRGFAGALVKSDLQKERFASVGVAPIAVTGELRFDQPIPKAQLVAGAHARRWLARDRVLTIASAVEGEDATYIDAIQRLQGPDAPLVVYVPRKPERFAEVGEMLRAAGLRVGTRSEMFDAHLAPQGGTPRIDVLLGDSLGEMYFYLALCDRALVGGGFTPHGAHNVIEPLALKKPVIVGPEIWTIEYPAREAIAAGVCTHVQTVEELAGALRAGPETTPQRIDAFFAAHAGAVPRTLAAIEDLTSR